MQIFAIIINNVKNINKKIVKIIILNLKKLFTGVFYSVELKPDILSGREFRIAGG